MVKELMEGEVLHGIEWSFGLGKLDWVKVDACCWIDGLEVV